MVSKKSTKQIGYRQGDVLILPVPEQDFSKAEEIKPDNGRQILAYGEVTGHAHALPMQGVKQFKLGDKEFVQITNKEGSVLKHEEHANVNLPQGTYEKLIAREYTVAGPRRVLD